MSVCSLGGVCKSKSLIFSLLCSLNMIYDMLNDFNAKLTYTVKILSRSL